MSKRVCICGKPSNHQSFKDGEEVRLCCACHIAAGGTAADWHYGCMNAIGRIKDVVDWDKQPADLRSSLV